jgi:hypothetical protein
MACARLIHLNCAISEFQSKKTIKYDILPSLQDCRLVRSSLGQTSWAAVASLEKSTKGSRKSHLHPRGTMRLTKKEIFRIDSDDNRNLFLG